jgi:hypothetical protein
MNDSLIDCWLIPAGKINDGNFRPEIVPDIVALFLPTGYDGKHLAHRIYPDGWYARIAKSVFVSAGWGVVPQIGSVGD